MELFYPLKHISIFWNTSVSTYLPVCDESLLAEVAKRRPVDPIFVYSPAPQRLDQDLLGEASEQVLVTVALRDGICPQSQTLPLDYVERSKRSRFMTFPHAATKSLTNVFWESSHA